MRGILINKRGITDNSVVIPSLLNYLTHILIVGKADDRDVHSCPHSSLLRREECTSLPTYVGKNAGKDVHSSLTYVSECAPLNKKGHRG
jgi:hypothetical protein